MRSPPRSRRRTCRAPNRREGDAARASAGYRRASAGYPTEHDFAYYHALRSGGRLGYRDTRAGECKQDSVPLSGLDSIESRPERDLGIHEEASGGHRHEARERERQGGGAEGAQARGARARKEGRAEGTKARGMRARETGRASGGRTGTRREQASKKDRKGGGARRGGAQAARGLGRPVRRAEDHVLVQPLHADVAGGSETGPRGL